MKKGIKRTASLRSNMILLMAFIVCLQSIVLALSLVLSGVYNMLDAEAFRFFKNSTLERQASFNQKGLSIIENLSEDVLIFSDSMQIEANQKNESLSSLYLNDALYQKFAIKGTDYLISLIKNNSITGAFLLLNGSNADKKNPQAHSAIYIRNSAPGLTMIDNRNLLLEIGPIKISKDYQIATGINWDLEIAFDEQAQADRYAYYFNPIKASAQQPKAEIKRYAYWSPPFYILDDNQQVICLTMPLLDHAGIAYGVMGVEISLSLITRSYLPNANMPFPNSFFAIMPFDEKTADLSWVIPSGPTAQVHLQKGENLTLTSVRGAPDFYETTISGLGEMYCARDELKIYSKNSSFIDERWSLVGFVSQTALHETSSKVRNVLTFTILVTTMVAFIAIFLLANFSTRKIVGLSKYIDNFSSTKGIHFGKTGMREIDELTEALERLNKNVTESSKRVSKLLELTSLPLGLFELSFDNKNVVLTEYVYALLELDDTKFIPIEDWEKLFAKLTEFPEENFESVYRYQLAENDKEKWLRIIQTDTDSGKAGFILDVTKDVEDRRRMMHELDYDALTHLYNRNAFKREAGRQIEENPKQIGAMIFADLDNLKYVNDTYGHDSGDQLIIRAGEMFRVFEEYGGLASRISGDEFAVYLHGFSTQNEIKHLIDSVYAKSGIFTITTRDGKEQRIRCSSGIAWYPSDAYDITGLLKYSDYAMYEAKHNSKGSIFEFNKKSYNDNVYLLENREAINKLLDEKLIRFAYQPIVDLKTGRIFAYEALMRSLHPDFHSPQEILAVATAQSKLGQLESLVINHAFQTIADNIDNLQERMVFINSIPSQRLSDLEHIQVKREYADIFKYVVVEITEAEAFDLVKLNEKAEFTRETGMKLAIDDFGNGYSNEVRILSIQPDIVKIDIELIRDIHKNVDKQKLVRNLISFCHPKGIKMVAEGVEIREELEKVIELGMDYVQGYFLARPEFNFQEIDPEKAALICEIQAKHSYYG